MVNEPILKEFYSKNMEFKVSKIKSYYSSVKDELAKVIFPIKQQVRSAYLSVFVVVTVITLFLALIDSIMSLSLSAIMN